MSSLVLAELREGAAILTLNRPGKLNALNYELLDQLAQNLDRLEDDTNVHVVIITGAGDRAFSAGADIREFVESINDGADAAVKRFAKRGQAVTDVIETFPKPTIAAVNGLAYGGGCEIIEACHLAIASEHASFAKPEINIGITPVFGGTQRLPRLAGRKRALEHLLTGDPFSAERAYELGLVNLVVPHGELLSATFAMAHRIMHHSTVATARIIAAVTRGLNTSIAEGLSIEREQFARLVPTHDTREALDAWLNSRKPSYIGK